MIFAPQEQEKIGTYFLPAIGPAPTWCTFLEQLTEELEESQSTSLYEDYKFLTTVDLEKLQAAHLIGTPTLRAYMHGYFMELKAYQKLVAAVNPFEFEKYRKDLIQKKIREKTERRINIQKNKTAKVNVDYVRELEQRQKDTSSKAKKAAISAGQLLQDDRFAQVFENPEFAIDKDSENYKILKPTATTKYAGMAGESEEEREEEPVVHKPKGNLNNLFAGKDDDESLHGDHSGEEDLVDNFEKKLTKDQRKLKKHGGPKDKIIKNYGESGIHQRSREYGEKLLNKASARSKDIKKSNSKI